jgi:cobalamin biosynthesis protein CobD/CbiB
MQNTTNTTNKAITVSTNDTSRKSSGNSWIEMNQGMNKNGIQLEKLKFYNKSGRKYSARITYMSVVLRNGL